MKFFTTAKHKLTFTKLSDCLDCAPIAAKWAEDEWGYIRNKGIEFREQVLRGISDDVYIGFYAEQPVAMFAFLPHEYHTELATRSSKLPTATELMYVYVDEKVRGLGFGRQVVDKAKAVAQDAGAQLIYFDTLKQSLNRFYENQGAKLVCEGRLFTEPTDVFYMKA